MPEVLGKHPGRILQGPDSESEAIDQIRQGLDANLPFRGEITNYRKNGEAYLCRLVIHPVYDDKHTLTNYIAFEVDSDTVQEEIQIPMLQLEEKYTSSSLKGANELQLYFRMKKALEEKELYLDPNLSLRSVADKLGTNTKYLSQVVNHHANCNFQQFINQYRIAKVKEKIKDRQYDNFTLFGIARQCGFKNKSTFYKVFKAFTGVTPRQYLSTM